MNRLDGDRGIAEATRAVMVIGPEPHRSTALRYLGAEARLSAVDSDDSAAEVWGALVVDPAGAPAGIESRYPALAIVAVAAGAPVAPAPEIVADRAAARLLRASRRANEADALVRAGAWRPADVPPALHGSTATVVGIGEDADCTARRLRALACEVTVIADPDSAATSEAAGKVTHPGASHWVVLLPSCLPPGVAPKDAAASEGPGVIDARDVTPVLGAPDGVAEHGIRRAVRDLAATAASARE